MQQVLSRVARALNDSGVLWCVGGSVLLHQYGLAEHPNDLDLLVSLQDAERAAGILGAMGETLPNPQTAAYATKCFKRFVIDGTGVDMMAGFAISHAQGRYEYAFDDASIAAHRIIGGVPVPFAALEDWYVAYRLIPGKEHKAGRIGDFLLQGGARHPELLRRALEGCLPESVRAGVLSLLRESPEPPCAE